MNNIEKETEEAIKYFKEFYSDYPDDYISAKQLINWYNGEDINFGKEI